MNAALEALVIAKTHRVPLPAGPAGDAAVAVRQFDAVAMSAGFKLSRGPGRVALPLAFMRGDDGRWRAKWLNLYLRGNPQFNRIEENKVSASLLARAVIERDYLRVGYLTDLMARAGDDVLVLGRDPVPAGPVTFVGLDQPDGLAGGSAVYTLLNLSDLIPA